MKSTEDFGPYLKSKTTNLITFLKEMNACLSDQGIDEVDLSEFELTIERQIQTAEKDFTICFYGSYNGGKSTIINSLLGLKGAQRLSSNHLRPDTAKSIRLTNKVEENQAEVVITYEDGHHIETTWEKAKNLTSQVHLNHNSETDSSPEKIVEIEYRISDNPILKLCDIVDLPGTGTAFGDAHNKIANNRIKESELVFWVVPTSRPEPDGNELRNLRELQGIGARIIPLINVWKDTENEISGLIEPEKLKPLIIRTFGRYFSEQPDILEYQGFECDKARQKEEQPLPETSYDTFRQYLFNNLIGNKRQQRQEKINRITSAVIKSTVNLERWILQREEELERKESDLDLKDEEAENLKKEVQEIESKLHDRFSYKANITADKMITIFSDQAVMFLEKQMTGFNLTKIGGKKKQEEQKAKLERKFKKYYLMLDSPNGPINSLAKDYLEKATEETKYLWQRFINMPRQDNTRTNFSSEQAENFVVKMMDHISDNGLNRSADFFIGGALLAGLLPIPGANVIALIGILGIIGKNAFMKDADKHRIQTIQEARLEIDQHRTPLANSLRDMAKKIHEEAEKEFFDNWQKASTERERDRIKISNCKNKLEKAIEKIQRLTDELKTWSNSPQFFA